MIGLIITIGLAIVALFYFLVTANIVRIRANWSLYRCNPVFMLLAFVVEDPGGFSAIAENFEYCVANVGKEVAGQMVDGMNSQFSLIGGSLSSIMNPLGIFRSVFSMMRGTILSFANTTLGKINAPLTMFIYYLNKIQDLIRRMVGEGYIAAFFGITVVSFIEGFVSLLLAIIEGFVYTMLVIAVILALFQPVILAIVLVLASSLAAAGG
jgi:hypothetical protein